MKNLTDQPAWQALTRHYQSMAGKHMRDWFTPGNDRFSRFSIKTNGILLDYSRHRINADTMQLLQDLATSMDVTLRIKELFSGRQVNTTEHRQALHSALRQSPLTPQLLSSRQYLYQFVTDIHTGKRTSFTNKPFKHVVNIGIGGSYLGPKMCTEALKDFAVAPLTFHFMSTVDSDHVRDILDVIDPETTLFIISSKSFTTIETLTNARTALAWLTDKLGAAALQQQTVAVTANKQKALDFGIADDCIFTFDDWVGGRYSIWSPIGLPLVLMLGPQQFDEFLKGAELIDQHFQQAPLDKNIPVTLALLGIWYHNFFDARAHAIIPYAYRLRTLVKYIQQLDMESNGKSVTRNAELVNYATGPVIFGEEGCNSQHTFNQLLHQGQHLVPIDFIMVSKPHQDTLQTHHDIMTASALSQSYAFMHGKTAKESMEEQPALTKDDALHRAIDGNKPNSLIILDVLTPATLGALIAIYEHKIYVQSIIWNINAFDQWGVELGKQTLPNILHQINQNEPADFSDTAINDLINHFITMKEQV